VRAARPLWEGRLSDQRLDYLDDHLVQGALVFPGAAYVEMALAANRDAASSEAIVLRDVRFERALFIKERTDTLVQLGLARTHAIQGDRENSRKAYDDFFTTWKDADPDIPILRQAKAEYKKLTETTSAAASASGKKQ